MFAMTGFQAQENTKDIDEVLAVVAERCPNLRFVAIHTPVNNGFVLSKVRSSFYVKVDLTLNNYYEKAAHLQAAHLTASNFSPDQGANPSIPLMVSMIMLLFIIIYS